MTDRTLLSTLVNRFITRVERDELTGVIVFYDARKNPFFQAKPSDLYDMSGRNFEDDLPEGPQPA